MITVHYKFSDPIEGEFSTFRGSFLNKIRIELFLVMPTITFLSYLMLLRKKFVTFTPTKKHLSAFKGGLTMG